MRLATFLAVLATVFIASDVRITRAAGGTETRIASGDTQRTLEIDGRQRRYLVHVPESYDAAKPTPLVLVLHGAGTNGALTVWLTGMSKKADEAGFIAVYPDGTGAGPFLTWNAGGWQGKFAEGRPDDVKFLAAVLDELEATFNVDKKRIFATGMSNGGMMCYRLAAELPDRIAAIAPVSGTMAIDEAVLQRDPPLRAVSVLHIHGKADTIVPFDGFQEKEAGIMDFKSVAETIEIWRKHNGCPEKGETVDLPNIVDDGTSAERTTYGPGRDGSEVALIEIEGGGHAWPGRTGRRALLGKSSGDVKANDLIWEFFERHPLQP